MGQTFTTEIQARYRDINLAGHVDTRTTEGYRHSVRPALPHAVEAWNGLLERRKDAS